MPGEQQPSMDPLDEALARVNSLGAPAGGSSPASGSPSGSPSGGDTGGAPPGIDDGSGKIGSFVRGAADALTFGFSDELSAGLDTIDPTNKDSAWYSSKTISQVASANLDKERALLKGGHDANPWTFTGGQVVGSLVIPVGAGARAAKTTAAVALAGAKAGAVQGGLYGLGSGDDIKSRLSGGAEGAVLGGAIGAAGGVIIPRVVNGAKKLLGIGTRAAEAAPEVAAAEAPREISAWGTNPEDGTQVPIFRATAEEKAASDLEALRPTETPAEGASPKPATSTPEEPTPSAHPEEVPLTDPETGAQTGTIGRRALRDLQAQVEHYRNALETDPSKRAADVVAGTPEAEHAGAFRLGSLGGVDDTVALLRSTVNAIPGKVTRSDADLQRTAGSVAAFVGEDPEVIHALGQQVAGKLGDADTAMLALRTVWASSAESINSLHLAGVDWATAGEDAVQAAGTAIRNLTQLSAMVQEAKTGLGRGLRSLQLPTPEEYSKTLTEGRPSSVPARERPPLPTSKDQIKDWFDLWGQMGGDPGKQAKFLSDALTVPTPGLYARTSFANLFTSLILSAPKTVALNVIGPSYISLVRTVERSSGGAAAALNPLLSAEERASAWQVAKSAWPAYAQTFGDIQDAFRAGLQAAEQNHTLIGGGGQLMDAQAAYGPLTDNLLNAANVQPDWRYTLGNLVNVFPKAFARVNNGLDEMAKRLAYQGEVRANAMVEAAQKGLRGEDVNAFVQDKLRSSYDLAGRASDKALLNQAERSTLTGTPGAEDSLMRKFGGLVQTMRKEVPETRYVLPVFNVPVNALGETLRRLPIAYIPGVSTHLGFAETTAELAGERGAVAQADAHGRFMMGAAFLTGGLLLNRMGVLTGAGPQESTDRRTWLQTHQPYSILANGEWVRYDKFDLLGGLLSIPATISDQTVYRATDKGAEDLLWSGMGALAQWFKDRAALRNAAGLFAMGGDPTANAGTWVSALTGGMAAGFAGGGITRTITDVTDPYQRMKEGWADYMKSAIPGLSRTLEPVRNVLGEPMNRPNDTYAEAIFPITMAPATSFKTAPELDELDRLYRATGYGAGADPKSLGYGYFDPREVPLEDGTSLYTHAMRARQEMRLGGQTLKETLGKLFESEAYNSAVDADPMQAKTSLGDLSRGYMVKRVFDRYNSAIKAELGRGSATALSYLTAAAAKQRDDAYLKGVSAEDLATNPKLYQAHGINQQAYQDKVMAGSTGALVEAFGGGQ